MRLFRFILLAIMCFCYYGSLAQTQQGFVKTLGRPDKKGEALSGVSVRVKGEHNAVLSKNDGTFSMLMAGKKVGDSYSLQQVQKTGYELNEMGVIGRQYAFSDKVPLNIVMVSTSQLQADKQRIENNAYKVAEKNYHVKMAQLEKDKEAGAITIETYRQEIQNLQDKFEKYQLLIDDLADHYAHTDYDGLDEMEREINICIENGDLERADYLIHAIFDPVDVLKRNKETLTRIDQNLQQANNIMTQAKADMAAVLKQQEKDAEYLYLLYTISLAKFNNDKAKKYIEIRAALDTTNCEWQYDAGEFLREYSSDYDKALIYYNRIFNCSVSDDEDDFNLWWSSAFNAVGAIMVNREEFDDAIEYFKNAADISIYLNGEDTNPDFGTACSNIGLVYNSQGKYEQALTQFKVAANNSIQCYGDNHPEVALCYNNIGGVYNTMGNYNNAIPYFMHALEIYQAYEGDVNSAVCYNNLGIAYTALEDYKEAIDNYTKALNLWKKVYGEMHPNTATVYNNIGELCRYIGQYEKAYKCYAAAFSIYKTIYGEEHSNLAVCYNNIGVTSMALEKYEQAASCFSKAIDIIDADDANNLPLFVKINNNLGELNRLTKNYEVAIVFYENALEKAKELYTDNSIDVGMIYNNIGFVYKDQNKDAKAIHYLNLAYKTLEDLLPEDHSYLLSIKEKLKTLQKY